MVRFGCRTDIAAPVALVFDLSSNIDAHLGSMRRFGEQAVAGVTTGQIGPGQDEATQLVDLVEFQAPLGLLGRLAEILVLGRYVRHLIETRNGYLKQQAEALSCATLPPDTP
jgi:hypothetical protein